MLFATALALTAAVLHAGWNLLAKRSGDPVLALWGQFVVAGVIAAVGLVIVGGVPAGAWPWALGSAAVHVPYAFGLGWAYRHGDFSLAYPLARGGGALLAAIGGLALLGDSLRPLAVVAIVIVAASMALLARGAARTQVAVALGVAATIATYTLFDSRGARQYPAAAYVFASGLASAVTISLAALASGRLPALLAFDRRAWLRTCGAGVMTLTAYGLVLVAVRHAPVGYVAALRESSVLIAVVVGSRLLDEDGARLRLVAATAMLGGLVLLVAAR